MPSLESYPFNMDRKGRQSIPLILKRMQERGRLEKFLSDLRDKIWANLPLPINEEEAYPKYSPPLNPYELIYKRERYLTYAPLLTWGIGERRKNPGLLSSFDALLESYKEVESKYKEIGKGELLHFIWFFLLLSNISPLLVGHLIDFERNCLVSRRNIESWFHLFFEYYRRFQYWFYMPKQRSDVLRNPITRVKTGSGFLLLLQAGWTYEDLKFLLWAHKEPGWPLIFRRWLSRKVGERPWRNYRIRPYLKNQSEKIRFKILKIFENI